MFGCQEITTSRHKTSLVQLKNVIKWALYLSDVLSIILDGPRSAAEDVVNDIERANTA